MPYKEKLMKTKTAFTTAAILFAFSTGSALAADEKSVFKNLPSPNKKIYCGENALLQKFKEKNSQKGFSYLALVDSTEGNEDTTWVTHDNSLFLMRQISELNVEDGVGIDNSTDNCSILSEDISDYKSFCYVGYEQGLDYAIELYAKDQHRVELNWQKLIDEEVVSDSDDRRYVPTKYLEGKGFPDDYVVSRYSLVRSKIFLEEFSHTIYTVIFSKKSLKDPDMKHLVEKEHNNGCYNIIEIKEK
jgi:hypothetical protein